MIEATVGDVISVNPNEVHDGIPLGGQARAWRMLYLDPALVTEAIAEITQGRATGAELAFPKLRHAAAANAFEALHRAAMADNTTAAAHADERLLALLAELVQVEPAERPLPQSAIMRTRARIDANPADSTPLATLAYEAGLSRFQLVRAFVHQFGLPPHAYRVQKRAHLARHLILAGSPLAEAAFNAGFADQAHMTRTLTRAYGVTPSAFARLACKNVQDKTSPSMRQIAHGNN